MFLCFRRVFYKQNIAEFYYVLWSESFIFELENLTHSLSLIYFYFFHLVTRIMFAVLPPPFFFF